jgi:hypothetical protein
LPDLFDSADCGGKRRRLFSFQMPSVSVLSLALLTVVPFLYFAEKEKGVYKETYRF